MLQSLSSCCQRSTITITTEPPSSTDRTSTTAFHQHGHLSTRTFTASAHTLPTSPCGSCSLTSSHTSNVRLGVSASERARRMTPQEMALGGQRNGQKVDPVAYLLRALHARFASLEEQSRLTSTTEMLAFQARPVTILWPDTRLSDNEQQSKANS
jgi:hypothetical protein